MWEDENLLLPGEVIRSRYQIAIARRTRTAEWVPTVPPLDAAVTNYRLLLRPQTRRRMPPAVIPGAAINQVKAVAFGYRQGVRLILRNGMHLYLMVSWRDGDPLDVALERLLTPSVSRGYSARPSTTNLLRLVQTIKKL